MSVYLVTGGANGLGAEIARHLYGAGNSVVFADINRADLPGMRSVMCDLCDEAQIASLMLGVEAIEGELDGLICHPCGAARADLAHTGRLISAAGALLRPGGGAVAIHARDEAALPRLALLLAQPRRPGIRMDCFVPVSAQEHIGRLTRYLAG